MTDYPIERKRARLLATERMRRHRQRRRNDLQSFVVELRVTEITALVRMGWLQSEIQHDRNAILKAFYRFLDGSLGRLA